MIMPILQIRGILTKLEGLSLANCDHSTIMLWDCHVDWIGGKVAQLGFSKDLADLGSFCVRFKFGSLPSIPLARWWPALIF